MSNGITILEPSTQSDMSEIEDATIEREPRLSFDADTSIRPTERKRTEEELRMAAYEETKKALERERKFIEDASHYFFNPLCIAKGYLELRSIISETSVIGFDRYLGYAKRPDKLPLKHLSIHPLIPSYIRQEVIGVSIGGAVALIAALYSFAVGIVGAGIALLGPFFASILGCVFLIALSKRTS